ncbi:MAG TPA: hypothetical protein VK893_01840, partial [Pyrinomonadaceae bacterium]|nr:hypothetical protein [Pyrinomonadaceae bacterium]
MKPSPQVRELIIETKKQLEHLRAIGVENIGRPHEIKQGTRVETFEQIHAEVGRCTRCPLHL